MDLLFKRYASPFSLIDGYIRTTRFFNFVVGFVDILNEETEQKNEETEQKLLWEFWLYRVWNMTFKEYLEKTTKKNNNVFTNDEIETTVKNSQSILSNFNPATGGEKKINGCI